MFEWEKDIEELNESTDFVPENTVLYDYINEFYESRGKSPEDYVTNYREFDTLPKKGFSFDHGYGYDYIDRDLLGGNGSGKTRKEFDKFVEEKEIEFEVQQNEFPNRNKPERVSLDEEIGNARSASKEITNKEMSNTNKNLNKEER